MCGICGIYSFDGTPVEKGTIYRMAEAMRHRGPDDEGYYFDGNLGLGHRRLSIIDIEGGHQPMPNEDETVWIVYSGEVYNYIELRGELESKGHRFSTKSDTETIIHLYEEEGEDCVKRLDGMFAFAVWDGASRRLFLVRDRMGIKPLYYFLSPKSFIFASEIKSILASGAVRSEIDYEALAEYFTFQNTYGDKTLFKGIKLLEPATTMVISGDKVSASKYWDLRFNIDDSAGEDYFVERMRSVLDVAVRKHLISDVPVGSYLSGGIDSASIVAISSNYIKRMATFTCGFDTTNLVGLEASFDERADSERVASAFKTEHYEMVMHPGDMVYMMPRLINVEEELRLGMSYQNHYAARLASKFVKVVLGGSGGDELFAGYPWRYGLVGGWKDPSEFERNYYNVWVRLIPDSEKRNFFSDEVWEKIKDYSTFESFRRVLGGCNSDDPLDKALYFDIKTFLHGLLTLEDKINMSYSVEMRVPLLGNDLVDFASTVPSRYKLNGGTGKDIFRKAMRGILPEFIVNKRKQGFSPPDGSWYKGETMGYIREILYDDRAMKRGFFNYEYIDRVIDEHLSGRVNHRLLIWSLLCFEWWNRIFIDCEKVGN
ncbi:MAG: asparagine synthase (glutamine-hydrolyzing) [bacterium]